MWKLYTGPSALRLKLLLQCYQSGQSAMHFSIKEMGTDADTRSVPVCESRRCNTRHENSVFSPEIATMQYIQRYPFELISRICAYFQK